MAQVGSDPALRDAQDVARVLSGDAAARDALVLRYRGIVLALAAHVLRDAYAAEDVCQEALLRALAELQKLRDPASFGPWLKRIALRECSAWARRCAVRDRAEERAAGAGALHDPFLDQQPPDAGEISGYARSVEEAVEKLSGDQCEVLALFYVKGLSHEEISNFLGLPRGTVKRRLFDARRKLQRAVPADRPAGDRAAQKFLEAFNRTLRDRLNRQRSVRRRDET
jgi:RNA polymerase sigma factor (sigma-70 family)